MRLPWASGPALFGQRGDEEDAAAPRTIQRTDSVTRGCGSCLSASASCWYTPIVSMRNLAVWLFVAVPAVSAAQPVVWTIDPGDSAAQFSVRHMVVSNVTGEFDGPTTTVDRRDFGLIYGRLLEGGGLVIGEQVAITIDLELTRTTVPTRPVPGAAGPPRLE